MGWVLVMFDLPVLTKKQRQQATKFRNSLLDDGYYMIQYSVYARSCPTSERLDKHKSRLRRIVPHAGNIRVLFLTDYQWQRGITVMGSDYNHGSRQTKLVMPRQTIFWE